MTSEDINRLANEALVELAELRGFLSWPWKIASPQALSIMCKFASTVVAAERITTNHDGMLAKENKP
mgnify:CR=1 FL=1